MKKNLILLMSCASVALYAQTGKVGINTPTPTANLHVKGTLRLEHPYQGSGRVLISDANGGGNWESLSALKNFITGDLNNGTAIVPTSTPQYSGVKITLPTGYYLVTVNLLLEGNDFIANGEGIWVRSSWSDSTTSGNLTTDVPPNTADKISGGIVGPSNFGMLQGNMLLNNTGTTPKTYYLWVSQQQINTTKTLRKFGLTNNSVSENSVYAIRIK